MKIVPTWTETCCSDFCKFSLFLIIQRFYIIECISWTIKHFLNIFNLRYSQWKWNTIFSIRSLPKTVARQNSGQQYDRILLYRKHSNIFRPRKPRLCFSSWFCSSKNQSVLYKVSGLRCLRICSFSHLVKNRPCLCVNHVLPSVIEQYLEPREFSPTHSRNNWLNSL